MQINIINDNCLNVMADIKDYSIDLIFTDPPYALGSDVTIRADGKPDYSKAVDFMNKWQQPDGKFWEQWFKEAYRILKYGGRVVMFGVDRQLMLNKYYACLSGFVEQQSLYWYFISNFPKSSDLSKMIDKNAGAEREVVGKISSYRETLGDINICKKNGNPNQTIPKTNFAKKYDGYKYSVAPLKQTNETIMVFQKPYKTGSCLHDTLAYENGDKVCLCGALDIDGNRVPFESTKNAATNPKYRAENGFKQPPKGKLSEITSFSSSQKEQNVDGRYPAQTFIDSETAKVLDEQSGLSKSSPFISKTTNGKRENTFNQSDFEYSGRGYDDTGGCSRILHKCDYDEKDFDLYIYCPKVNKSERNAGCESLPEKELKTHGSVNPDNSGNNHNTTGQKPAIATNNHPTVKPINLLVQVLSLFKTPNPQVVLDTFAGSGSIGIACEKLKIDYILIDDKKEYCDIAELRTKYWAEKFKNETQSTTSKKQMINNDIAKDNNQQTNDDISENQLSLFE